MNTNFKFRITNALLLTWLVACTVLFVYISRTSYVQIVSIFNVSFILDMLNKVHAVGIIFTTLLALLGALLFSLSCLSVGMFVLRKQFESINSKLALGVSAFITGEVIYSVLFLFIISVYKLTPVFVAIICTIGLLAGLQPLKTLVAQPSSRSFFLSVCEQRNKIILGLVIFNLFLGLFLTSTRLGYDASAEYFSHAKIMAVSQRPVFFYPSDYFVVSSFHPGILFTALIQLFGDQCARMLSWINGVVILLTGLAIIRELGLKSQTEVWFLVLMITTTAYTDLLGDGKIELITTTPILGAVYWMIYSRKEPARHVFFMIGMLAGFAIISRPYNIFLVGIFILIFYLLQIIVDTKARHFDFTQYARFAYWMSLPILLLGIFHLVENWLFLDNPLAPLSYAKELDAGDWQWHLNPALINYYRLFYPLALTFLNSQQSIGNISPLFVGIFPFLFLKKTRANLHFPRSLGYLVITAIVSLLLWITLYFTILEIRYVFFLWVILFIATAYTLDNILHNMEHSIQTFLGAIVAILLAVMCVRTLLITLITYFPPDNMERGKAYCPDSKLCVYMDTINQSASSGDRVLALHAYRYYLRSDLFACSSQVGDYAVLEPYARQNSPNFWVETYRHGYRYIIYEKYLSENRYHFGDVPAPITAPDWLHIKTLYSSSDATQLIYEIEPVSPPIFPDFFCIQNADGIWEIKAIGG